MNSIHGWLHFCGWAGHDARTYPVQPALLLLSRRHTITKRRLDGGDDAPGRPTYALASGRPPRASPPPSPHFSPSPGVRLPAVFFQPIVQREHPPPLADFARLYCRLYYVLAATAATPNDDWFDEMARSVALRCGGESASASGCFCDDTRTTFPPVLPSTTITLLQFVAVG